MALAATLRLSSFRPPAIAVLAGMLALVPLGLALGTGGMQFASTGLVYLPLILLTGLLQIPKSRAARVLSWIWFWLLVITSAAIAATLSTDLKLLPTQPTLLRDPAVAMSVIIALGMVLAATPGWYVIGRGLGAVVQRGYHAHAQGTVGLLLLAALGLTPLALRGGVAPLVALLDQLE